MSPKQAKISIFLALFYLYLTSLSSALSNCPGFPGFNSIPDILRRYELPTGIFPDNVKSFSCVSNSDFSYKLTIQLYGVCQVTRSMFGVKNIVVCEPEISATISYQQLTNVKGVTVTLFVNGGQVGELMTIKSVRAVGQGFVSFLQFDSDKGPSPWFPYLDIAQEPPKCDIRSIPLLLGA